MANVKKILFYKKIEWEIYFIKFEEMNDKLKNCEGEIKLFA